MIATGLCLSLLTATADPSVVLSRRSGVAAPRALQIAREVAEQLEATGLHGLVPVEDASSCKAKKACLLALARKKAAPVLITVEVASAMNDGSLRVEALSVEEDGKQVSLLETDGPVEELVKRAAPRLRSEFAPKVRATLGLELPPPPPPAPPVVVAAPATTPPALVPAEPVAVAPPVAVEARAPGLGPQKLVGATLAGLGVVALGVAGVWGAQASADSAASTRLCPTNQPCTNPAAYARFDSAAAGQSRAGLLAGVGGAALLAGALTFLLAPSPAASTVVSFFPVEGGAQASVTTRF